MHARGAAQHVAMQVCSTREGFEAICARLHGAWAMAGATH